MHQNHLDKGVKFSITLREVENASRYGQVEVCENYKLTKFKEKSPEEVPGLIQSGIYLINKSIFSDFDLCKKFSFEVDFMQKYINSLEILGFLTNGYFIDIGIPKDYNRFCEDRK